MFGSLFGQAYIDKMDVNHPSLRLSHGSTGPQGTVGCPLKEKADLARVHSFPPYLLVLHTVLGEIT